MKRIGVGKEAEFPSPLLGENDLRDLSILGEDFIPDRDELLKGKREIKNFSQGLEKFQRGQLAHFIAIDRSIFKIEEIGEQV